MNDDEQRRTATEERRTVGTLEREADPPAALAAIEAVMALHRPESRFTVRGYEGYGEGWLDAQDDTPYEAPNPYEEEGT